MSSIKQKGRSPLSKGRMLWMLVKARDYRNGNSHHGTSFWVSHRTVRKNLSAKFRPANPPLPFIRFGNPDCREINACSSGKGGQHELLPTHLRAFSLFSPFLIPLFCFAPSVKCSRFPARSFFDCRSNPSSVYGFSRSHYSQ